MLQDTMLCGYHVNIHGLEKLGYLEQVEKKGRVVSRQGMQKLDKLATDMVEQFKSI